MKIKRVKPFTRMEKKKTNEGANAPIKMMTFHSLNIKKNINKTYQPTWMKDMITWNGSTD
jgi:hypothetical protein